MPLSLIIISYNTCELMRNCLNSLRAHPPSCEHTITVVDNASADDTAAMIRRDFPDVTVIANEDNVGYAAAINQGLGLDDSGDVLILNSDIEARPGTIDRLRECLAANPDAGMCAPQLILPDGRPQPTWEHGFTLGQFARQQLMLDKLPRGAGHPGPPESHEVEHLDGAALLVRREAIAAVGPMDEGYWMYCEDSDWELRFRRAGWKLRYVPDATMLHHHGASSRQCRAEMIASYNRAAARYFRLHEGALAGATARVLGVAGTSLRLFGAALASIVTLGLVRPV
ncbi:MAG: glycosyltransferase family 2 protein, partial [Armatimonadetes bacterium]|nr:glycosyltransferase family 2 protein [Armatimonadota bacterium]